MADIWCVDIKFTPDQRPNEVSTTMFEIEGNARMLARLINNNPNYDRVEASVRQEH